MKTRYSELMINTFPPDRNFAGGKIRVFKSSDFVDKLCIYPALSTVIINTEFFNSLTKIQKAFTFAHEQGHLYYKNELLCDCFAASCLLDLGYTLKDIYYALRYTLNENKQNALRAIGVLIYLIDLKNDSSNSKNGVKWLASHIYSGRGSGNIVSNLFDLSTAIFQRYRSAGRGRRKRTKKVFGFY